jgi:glucose-6-phosphate isomerase
MTKVPLNQHQIDTLQKLFSKRDVVASYESMVDGRTINSFIRRGLVEVRKHGILHLTEQGRKVITPTATSTEEKMRVRLVRCRDLDRIGKLLTNLPIAENGGG